MAKGVGMKVLRVLFPFSAMWDSVRLTREQLADRKRELGILKSMAQDVLGAVQKNAAPKTTNELTFAELELQCAAEGRASLSKHRDWFLRKKRASLLLGALFMFLGVLCLLNAALQGQKVAAGLCLMSVLVSQCMAFTYALGSELRIWQIETRRLSAQEGGGLADFVRDTPRWWLRTINPNIRWRSR